MQDEHGKKSPGTGALPGAENAANAPVKPAALTDADLGKVAGGISVSWLAGATNALSNSPLVKNKYPLG
jgi:hypothetical protein